MIKFNDNNIISGYIQQLLHTIYLPNFPVYVSDNKCYEKGLYVKDNNICQFINGSLIPIKPYRFNTRINNYTKTLKLENALYDWHTHEYLGEYLRFLKNYFKLNLMSLYNCYSGRIPEHLKLLDSGGNILASSSDDNSALYIIPVHFGSTYSIYVESSNGVEIMPILYDKGYYTKGDSVTHLVESGHKKYSNSRFQQPIIYDFLNTNSGIAFSEFYPFENDLKLLIKLPFNCNSSIVVLEDDQTHNEGLVASADPYTLKPNASVINFEMNYDTSEIKEIVTAEDGSSVVSFVTASKANPCINELPVKSLSQLTYINSHVSHPFADRLVEYLTDNAITHLDKVSDNIRRVQHELIRRKTDSEDSNNKSGLGNIEYEGIWESQYKGILYNVALEEGLLQSCFDILGYVDKDVEIKLGEDYDLYEDLWYEESK